MASIGVCSGKGGVGKTTVAANLGLVLSSVGESVIVVDGDFSMANLGILLGAKQTPVTLNHVLMGEAKISDAIYKYKGMDFMPAQLSASTLQKMDLNAFSRLLKKLEKKYDYVIVDTPPGLSANTLVSFQSVSQCLLVLAPEPMALADTLKVRELMRSYRKKIMGFVVNMQVEKAYNLKRADMETILDATCLGYIPFDSAVRTANVAQKPVVDLYPDSPASKAFYALSEGIIHRQIKRPSSRKTFLSRLKQAIGI